VSVVSLQKAKVKVGVRFGLQSEDQITLKFETPENSDLTLPKEVKVNAPPIGEEVATVEFEIQAGAKKGDFPVKVVPSEGPTVTVIVTVK